MTHKQKIVRDLLVIGISLVIGVILLKTSFVREVLLRSSGMEYFGIFLAGMFFISVFTTVPATIAIAELSLTIPLPTLIIAGALGALFGDYIIFRFVRDDIVEDFKYMFTLSARKRWAHIFKSRIFKGFLTLVGGIIIASPLPDELGLALIGISKINTFTFAIISLLCNAGGILIIALVAKSLA